MKEKPNNTSEQKEKKLCWTAVQLKRWYDFVASKEVQEVFEEYLEERRGPNKDWVPDGRVDTRGRVFPLAEKFVMANQDVCNGRLVYVTIEKTSRRLRDVFEDKVNDIKKLEEELAEAHESANALKNAEEQELPFDEPVIKGPNEREKTIEDAKTSEEKKEPQKTIVDVNGNTWILHKKGDKFWEGKGPVTAEQSGIADLFLIELRNLVEAIRTQNKILIDALFVKPGDLKFKNGNPKHVGWSWFHSLHSEAAQIRGLMAQGKPSEDTETAEDLAEELSQEMKGNKEGAQNG